MSKLDIREAIDCAVVSCLATKLITLDKCKLMSVLKLSYTITWCQYRFKNCIYMYMAIRVKWINRNCIPHIYIYTGSLKLAFLLVKLEYKNCWHICFMHNMNLKKESTNHRVFYRELKKAIWMPKSKIWK